MMQEVLRIADHFVDPRDPDSIHAHSQLGQMCVLVLVHRSGSRRGNSLRCFEAQAFDPLPEWYKGESLLFEITMKKVEAQEP